MVRYCSVVVLVLCLFFLNPSSSEGATIVVDSNAQSPGGSGDCTLGEAIQAANTDSAIDGCSAGSGADIITLPAGTYTLLTLDNTAQGDNGLPSITSEITINGAGSASTTITRSGSQFRLLRISNTGSLTLNDVTLSNGHATTNFIGGCILNYGTLTMNNSTVSGCTGASGGGIANALGTLNITNSLITGNTADTDTGGGIYNTGGTVTINGSTISSNQSTNGNNAGGGGIFSISNGTLNIYDSTISDNTSANAGGGIYQLAATMNIYRSTLSGNKATAGGGGIISLAIDGIAILVLQNSTISGNTSSSGGGVAFLNTDTTITNCTITGNDANTGGGIAINGQVDIENSIIANNTATSQGPDCAGTITTMNYSLIEDTGFCTLPSGTGNITGTDPVLGPLQDNGGPTFTHELLAGSPAIDSANNQVMPPTDQRGITRPQDGDGDGTAIMDMGAFELEAAQTTPKAVPTLNLWGMLVFVLLAGIGAFLVIKKKKADLIAG